MTRGLALGLLMSLGAGAEPHADIFYNARLALREGHADETLKLWLLRNSLVFQGVRPTHDGDFRSVVWAALGHLGLCQDGYAHDSQGAGLWPLAMHNWLLTWVAKGGAVEPPSPFDAFEVGLQQRLIGLSDVLSAEELRTVEFFRSTCWAPQFLLLDRNEAPWGDLNDRLVSGPLLRSLLVQALTTLSPQKVQHRVLLQARIFDLDLALTALKQRQAKQDAQMMSQKALAVGASSQAAQELAATFRTWPPGSPQARFLRDSLRWPVSEWLALSQARRLSLFSQARTQSVTPSEVEAQRDLVLRLIDALIDRKAGVELESWVGWLEANTVTARRGALIEGERGKRLLELDAASGFRERATIALHRGVWFLESGDLREALRSFAFALSSAESSRQAPVTLSLARRWVSYVLSRYTVNDEAIATLQALVPAQEYNAVVEDLVWRAALNADLASFDRVVATTRRGGAFDARVTRLRLLASGQAGALATQLRDSMAEEPFFTVRFIRLLIEKLEAEEADVRGANVPLLKLLVPVLELVHSPGAKPSGSTAHARAADELLGRLQALLEGLRAFETTTQGQARALSPRHEAFAGNIRLAPTDPLPWPFQAPEPEAPSAFTPIVMTPVEWRDETGHLIFGWRLSE